MAHAQQFVSAIQELRDTNHPKISFAELIARVWGGKVVEVYIGDTAEDLKQEDSTQKVVAVLIGKVITAYAEMLVLDCAYVDQRTRELRFGNIVCLNERSVRTITEVDETGILRDTFLNSKDGKIMKGLMRGK
jgi:hypothetical protein